MMASGTKPGRRRLWPRVSRRLALLAGLRSPGDVFLFVHIFAFAVAVPLFMRLNLPRFGHLLEPRRTVPAADPDRISRIVACVDLARRVGRPLVSPRCLTRGVTLYYFLRRAGLDVALCFGVGEVGDGLAGHCWLVKEGEPFLEAEDPRSLYTVTYTLSREG